MYINEQMIGGHPLFCPAAMHVLMGFEYPFAGNIRRKVWDILIRKGFRYEYFQ